MGANVGMFLTDTQKTGTDVDAFEPHVKKLDSGLKDCISVADFPKSIADGLGTLKRDLELVDDVLVILSPLPVVGEGAEPAERAVSELRKVVDPVAARAREFDNKVKPIRDRLKAAEKRVAQLIQKLEDLKAYAKKGHDAVAAVETCVQGHKLETTLDNFCGSVDVPVKAINTLLEAATKVANDIEKALAHLTDVGRAMHPIETAIDDVKKALHVLDQAAKPIRAALDQKISFPYSFKVKLGVTWKGWGPFKVPVPHFGLKTVNFTFTIHEVLKGVHGVIGIVQDGLMSLAKKVLHALHLKLPTIPEIPGLKELEQKMAAALGPIGKLAEDLESWGEKVEDILKRIHALEVSVDGFHLECP